MDIIKNYLESKISNIDFFEKLYKDQDLQKNLENEKNIHPYTNDGSLLFFLLSGNIKNMEFIIDVKDALRQFLQNRGIEFNYSNKESDMHNILMDVQPKWLDIQPDYFSDIIKKLNKENKKEIKEMIKTKIKKDFISMKNPPKWLQNPNWPIEDEVPLIFIGELDMGEILHDTSKVFIFYNARKNTFRNIMQSY